MSPRDFVAGHLGMVGSAVVRNLRARGHAPSDLITRTRQELDLLDAEAVGIPRKLMDSGRLHGLGWTARIELAQDLARAYVDFKKMASHGTWMTP